MTEIESYHVSVNSIPAFIRGEWIEIDKDSLEELCEVAAYDFYLNHPSNKYEHSDKISISKIWNVNLLIDAIMIFAYPIETIDLSISRLATAARYLGFSELSPYAVAICYFKFKSLSQEYKTSWKKTKKS